MAGEYYNHTTFPQTGTVGSSAQMRAELELIEAGFNKLPDLVGNALKLVRINASATAQEAVLNTTVQAADIVAATAKATPISTDMIPIVDSAAGNTFKKVTWADLLGTLDSTFLKSGDTAAALTITSATINGGTISGITDLAIVDGGTGSSTADGARTNLGVTATGADTTYAYRANNLSDLANVITARANLGLAIGTNVQAQLVSGTNIKTINSTSLLGYGDIQIVSAIPYGLFRKANSTIVAFTKTGAFTVSTATTIYVEVNGGLKTIASSTAVTMPGSATAGTDYAIWAKTDGTLEATANHTSPPSANARKIGGFHYAPGGNATGTSGGNTIPQINEYSFWDLKFCPACPDPRGMTLVGGGFWMDIYLTGVDAITNGSSKYSVTMADGSSPPKVPTMFGGNGSTTYGSYTWFEAMELATAFGKRVPTQREFMSAMYGTTEASSVGTDPVSTILNAAYTSKWGVMQSTGVLWIWGDDRGGAYNTGGWNANTEGRGSEYNAPNAVLLGGDWTAGSNSGSRCSLWVDAASDSNNNIGSRFCCDHLQLD